MLRRAALGRAILAVEAMNLPYRHGLRVHGVLSLAAACLFLACSGQDDGPVIGGGGQPSQVGSSVLGGVSSGGTTSSTSAGIGGVSNGGVSYGGAAATGGAPAGGVNTTGGAATGGAKSTGGAVTGGVATTGGAVTGGAATTGGAKSTGGAATTGGAKSTGGAATTGGAGTGGAIATGGANSSAGAAGASSGCPYVGHVTYTLAKATAPTTDQQTAYNRITSAMDTAIRYYNCYTNITKALNVSYVPSVATADGNINGSIRFGSSASMNRVTAMHEISHTVGVGTASTWASLVVGGKFTGTNALAQLLAIPNRLADTIGADTQHFWPYGLNYESEGQKESDLIGHCQMVVAIRKDLGLQ